VISHTFYPQTAITLLLPLEPCAQRELLSFEEWLWWLGEGPDTQAEPQAFTTWKTPQYAHGPRHALFGRSRLRRPLTFRALPRCCHSSLYSHADHRQLPLPAELPSL
jgi:hypothetical protein